MLIFIGGFFISICVKTKEFLIEDKNFNFWTKISEYLLIFILMNLRLYPQKNLDRNFT